ncbi:MAG: energy transducer TonB [Ignavibacteriaceae bacterium]|nr:energy transducer TonB [Ignavibacteriaceae bacterium]
MKLSKGSSVGEKSDLPDSPVIQKEEIQFEERTVKSESKSKIDWGSLSVIDSSTKSSGITDKIEVKKIVIKNEEPKIHLNDNQTNTDFEEATSVNEIPISAKSQIHFSAIQGTRKYALIFAVVFVVAVIVFLYFNLLKTSDNNYLQQDSQKPTNISITQEDTPASDSIEELIVPDNIQLAEEEQTKTKEKIIKQILPTPPPELPAPIETPVTELTETKVIENEDEQNKQVSLNNETELPPKEIVKATEEPVYFVAVEEMPAPLGGLKSIQDKIIYPEIAKRAGIEGKVFVRAYVDERGTVTSAEIVKGIGAGCDEAALDAVLNTKFSPGKQRGKPIKVQVTIPILFKR